MTQSTTTPPEDRLDFKRVLPVFAIVFVDILGLTIIIPLLHLYAASFGANAFLIGVVATAYPLMQFVGGPLLGGLSDRYGRKPILFISQVGTFVGFLVLGFANSLWMILLARVIDGISGANIAAAQAALTDVTSEKTRAQGLGLIGAAFGLGFIIGPIIALLVLLVSNNNYALVAFVAAGFSLIAILLTLFKFDETLPPEKRAAIEKQSMNPLTNIRRALGKPQLAGLLILIFAQQVIFFGLESLLGLFTLNKLGLDGRGNAVIFTIIGVVMVFVQGYFIGKWSRRFGELRLVQAGLLLLSAGLIFTALTPRQPLPGYSQEALIASLAESRSVGGEVAEVNVQVELPPEGETGYSGIIWIIVALVPVAIGGGILRPSINTLLTKRTSPAEVGAILGVSSAFVSAANAITPALGGFAFEQFGGSLTFFIGGIIIALLFLWALRAIREETAPIGDTVTESA